jgi:hypothetical protein
MKKLSSIALILFIVGLALSPGAGTAFADSDDDPNSDDGTTSADVSASTDIRLRLNNSGPGNLFDSDRAVEIRERLQERQEESQELREELRVRLEDRTDALQDSRGEIRDRLESRRDMFLENASDRLTNIARRILGRFYAAIERMEHIANRVDSRIAKLEERGNDLSEAKRLLAEAWVKIDAAGEAVAEVEINLGELIADTPHETLQKVRELLGTAKEALRSAHRALVDAIIAIRANVKIEDTDDDTGTTADLPAQASEDDTVQQSQEFEATVVAATDTTITLSDGRVITVNSNTTIEADGDILGLAGVTAALATGQNVRAEGDLDVVTNVASSVKFEIDG